MSRRRAAATAATPGVRQSPSPSPPLSRELRVLPPEHENSLYYYLSWIQRAWTLGSVSALMFVLNVVVIVYLAAIGQYHLYMYAGRQRHACVRAWHASLLLTLSSACSVCALGACHCHQPVH
jgi:hypothetical protein